MIVKCALHILGRKYDDSETMDMKLRKAESKKQKTKSEIQNKIDNKVRGTRWRWEVRTGHGRICTPIASMRPLQLLPLFVGGEFKSIWNVEAIPTKIANSIFNLDDSLYSEVVDTKRDMEGWHDLPTPDFILCGAGILLIVSTGPGVLDNMIILSQVHFGIIKYDAIIERELHLFIFLIQALSRPIQQIIYELGNVSTDVKSLIAVPVLTIERLNQESRW